MSEIFMTSGKTMMYRNTMIDIGDGSYDEIKQAMEKVDKGIEEEQFRKWSEFLKNHPIQLTSADDDRKRQAADLIENLRWARLTDRLDDIRDLLYINNLNQSAMLELMMGGYETPLSKRHAVDYMLGGAKKIGKSMAERNGRAKKHMDDLMAQFDALMKG